VIVYGPDLWSIGVPVVAIGIVTGIIAVLIWVGEAAVQIALAVAAALAAVWAVLGPILLAIWHSLAWTFNNVLKPVWDTVKKWGDEVWKLYVAHLKPIVDWIGKIAKTLRQIYTTFVQPIRDALSILEQFLRLSGLAHTAIGSWLDSELHRIDGTIARVWAELTRPINVLLHLVNEVILDVHGILQAPLLLESTATYMGHIAEQFWDKTLGTIHTNWGGILDSFHTGPAIKPSVDAATILIVDGAGELAPAVDHGVTSFHLLAAADYSAFDFHANGVDPRANRPTSG
jgi:phage-related protein